jgi:hypothetical protein
MLDVPCVRSAELIRYYYASLGCALLVAAFQQSPLPTPLGGPVIPEAITVWCPR